MGRSPTVALTSLDCYPWYIVFSFSHFYKWMKEGFVYQDGEWKPPAHPVSAEYKQRFYAPGTIQDKCRRLHNACCRWIGFVLNIEEVNEDIREVVKQFLVEE